LGPNYANIFGDCVSWNYNRYISVFIFKTVSFLQGVVVDGKQETRKECRFTSNPDSAQQLYSLLCEQQQSEYRQQFSVFPSAVGSNKMISVSFKIAK
jgi:hypothetical protein